MNSKRGIVLWDSSPLFKFNDLIWDKIKESFPSYKIAYYQAFNGVYVESSRRITDPLALPIAFTLKEYKL